MIFLIVVIFALQSMATLNLISFPSMIIDSLVVLPYISLGCTPGVQTETLERKLDGLSRPIEVDFPFGSQRSRFYVINTHTHTHTHILVKGISF